MPEKLQNFIKEKINALPKEAQEAINAFDWKKVTEEIGKKYLLSVDELSYFQIETLFVLVGITDREFYEINIENKVRTTKEDAEKIGIEVEEKIFEPIANVMEENIKKNISTIKPSVEQNLNFILSGGDYSVFIAPPQGGGAEVPRAEKLIGTSNILETKNKLIN